MESAGAAGRVAGESVMDLSLRSVSSSPGSGAVGIVRPVPRPPWSILWYQNLWSREAEPTSSTAIPDKDGKESSSSLHAQSPHRLYRLSTTASSSERCYPCQTSVDNPASNQRRGMSGGESGNENDNDNDSDNSDSIVVTTSTSDENSVRSVKKPGTDTANFLGHHTAVLDVACCDGPVQFKQISNPNFALTVEHNEVCAPSTMAMFIPSPKGGSPPAGNSSPARKHLQPPRQRQSQSLYQTANNQQDLTSIARPVCSSTGGENTSPAVASSTLKTYLCIYCNQSFKSLFCYQKHKKRHLNPVSVDITTTAPLPSSATRFKADPTKRTGVNLGGGRVGGILAEPTKAKTKDLNVQFFPCKKCGCKFPSYYFVHKHRKICH